MSLSKQREEFVRDICSIDWLKLHAKSEAKKRINKILEQQLEEVKKWAEENKKKNPEITWSLDDGEKYNVGYNYDLKDLTQLIDNYIQDVKRKD